MLVVAIMLAICSLVIEFLIISKSPRLRLKVTQSTMWNLATSLTIAWFLGAVFGAKGVTVLTAAMLATASSVCIYRVINGATHIKEKF
jgi:Na+/H+-translocating membrane pyrophosphatase|tara:strand:- start:319 stop:582 length:264 start_codon:yes stop_codon:yes gene_type:complete